MNESEKAGIALIGLGLLGTAIARRLLSSGWRVSGYDPDSAATERLVAAGGTAADSLRDVLSQSRIVLLCLPDETVSREVLTELLPLLDDPSSIVIVDTTTGAPDVMEQNCSLARSAGAHYVDACVGGSSAEMEQGEAIMMIGGDPETVSLCSPLFQSLVCKSYHVGRAGDGARMKLVTNLVLGLQRLVLAEGLSLAAAYSFDLSQTLEILEAGPARARVMATKGTKMISGDGTPQARLDQHWKDVRLILKEGQKHQRSLPLSMLHDKILSLCNLEGWGGMDNSAVSRAYFSGKLRIDPDFDVDFA